MKLIILWLINTVIVLPLKTITYIFKLIFKFINNIVTEITVYINEGC